MCKISVPVFSKVTPCQALAGRHYSLLNMQQKEERERLSPHSVSWGVELCQRPASKPLCESTRRELGPCRTQRQRLLCDLTGSTDVTKVFLWKW